MSDTAPKPTRASPPKPAKTKAPATATAKPPKEKSEKPRGRPPELQKQLEELLMGIGLMTSGAVNQFDGEVIRDNAASMAEAWHKVAQQNATVKRILTSMMETGAWSGAVMATAGIAIPIMQNHGAIPPGIPHPFKKPPHLEPQQQAQQPQPAMPHTPAVPGQPMPTPPHGVMVAPQQGSPITPSRATQSPPQPPPPPGAHSG